VAVSMEAVDMAVGSGGKGVDRGGVVLEAAVEAITSVESLATLLETALMAAAVARAATAVIDVVT
jgi:hypothetical protein